MRRIAQCCKLALGRFEEFACDLILAGIPLVVFYSALVRYLPISGRQMAWTEEVARLLLIWVVFWGAFILQRESGHFKVDLLVKRLGHRTQLLVGILVSLVMVVFLAFVGKAALLGMIERWVRLSAVLQFPQGLLWLPFFAWAILSLVCIVVEVILKIKLLVLRQ